jgi:hypothetical protein
MKVRHNFIVGDTTINSPHNPSAVSYLTGKFERSYA